MKRKISTIFILLVLALTSCKPEESSSSIVVHKHSYQTEVIEPDCLHGGYTIYTCTCGDMYIENETMALGHTYDELARYCIRCQSINPEYSTPGLEFVLNVDGTEYKVASYLGEALEVNIPESYYGIPVTEIESSVFENSPITKITMPSITTINDRAFKGANELTDIAFADNLSYIGEEAFYGSPLTEIMLPSSINYVGKKAFAEMVNLTKILIDTNLEETNIFENSGNNLEVTFNEATSIPGELFKDHKGITKLNLSNKITAIGEDAFLNCSNLKVINYDVVALETGVSIFNGCAEDVELNILEHVTSLPSKILYENTSIKELIIPSNITNIGELAFGGCSNLNHITLDTTLTTANNLFADCGTNLTVELGENVKKLCDSMFENTNITTISGGSNLTVIGNNVFKNSTLENIDLSKIEEIGEGTFKNTLITEVDLSALSVINESVFENTLITKLSSLGKIKEIKASAFKNTKLEVIDFSKFTALEAVGELAFSDNKLVETISFADYFDLAANTFDGCDNISSAYFKDSLFIPHIVDNSSIGGVVGKLEVIYVQKDIIFEETNYLIEFISNNELTFDGEVYYAYHNHHWNEDYSKCLICGETWTHYFTGGLEFSLNDSQTGYIISNYNGSSENITIPFLYNGKPIVGVGKNAFSREGIKTIDFNYCTNLKYISDEAFANCVDLSWISFKNCTSLSYITSTSYSSSVGAFKNCTSLESIEFTNCTSLTTIGDSTFSGCTSLEYIDLRNAQIEYILNTAFSDCTSLRRVIIPSTTTDIYANCFSNTGAVIYVEGSFEKPTGFVSNFANNCCVYYLGEYTFEEFVNITEDFEYIELDGKKILTIAYNQDGSFEVPEYITEIASYAFKGCLSYSSVVIKNNVEAVRANAFVGSHLTIYAESNSISIDKSNAVENAVYYSNERLHHDLGFEYIILNDEVIITQIDKNITEITIPDTIGDYNVVSIGELAFSNTKVSKIVLPETVEAILSGAFKNTLIKDIDLSYITTIEAEAFLNVGLEQVIFGSNLAEIGELAFANTKLEAVVIESSEAIIGEGAFYNTNLVEITIPYLFDDTISYLFKNGNDISGISSVKEINIIAGEVVGSALRGTNFEKVYLANNQDVIFYDTFSDMPYLSLVKMPNVTVIEAYAFYNTPSLKSVDLSTVESIDSYAFSFSGLENIFLESDLKYLGTNVFEECSNLAEININVVDLESLAEDANIFNKIKDNAVVKFGDDATKVFSNLFTENSHIVAVDLNQVTILENNAFANCFNLSDIELDNVLVFGASALENTLIDHVDLNINVLTIGDNAFKNCYNITNVFIPNETVEIGTAIFTGDKNITSISAYANTFENSHIGMLFGQTMSDGFIAANTHYVPSALESITIIGNEIHDDSFSDLVNVTSITFDATIIGEKAFSGCASVANFDMTKLTEIGTGAFSGCTALTNIVLTSTTTLIGEGAFSGCSNIESMTIPFVGSTISATKEAALFGYIFGSSIEKDMKSVLHSYGTNEIYLSYVPERLKEIVILDGNVSNGAFSSMNNLESIVLPSSISYIGASAFKDCSNILEFNLGENLITIGNNAFAGCSSITELVIPNSVLSIGEAALNGTSNLTSLEIPFIGSSRATSASEATLFGYIFGTSSYADSYSVIQQYSLTASKVTYYLPNKLTEVVVNYNDVLYGAFANTAVDNITINGATSLEQSAFEGAKLTSISLPNSLISIQSKAFYNCLYLEEINLPNSVKYIGSEAFSGCSNIANISIDSNINYLGDNAFSNCDNLSYIYYNASELSNDLQTNSNVFGKKNANILYTVEFGNNVINVPNYLFRNSTAVEEIIFCTSVMSIGEAAFKGATALANIQFVSGLLTIDVEAFSGCSSLTEITLPDTLKIVSNMAFYSCTSVKSLIIPNSVTEIGTSAFANLYENTYLSIGSGVTKINASAFANSSKVETVEYKIKTSDLVINPSDQIFYNFATAANLRVDFTNDVVVVPDNLFYVESSNSRPKVTSITFGNNLTTIGANAFYQLTSLNKVDFEKATALQEISSNAFYQTTTLETLDLSMCSDLEIIGVNSFRLSGLKTVKLPDMVKTISEAAFKDCVSLTTLTFEGVGNLNTIEVEAFSGATSLQAINLENSSITEIKSKAFANCTSLSLVNLRNCASLSNIYPQAFMNAGVVELDLYGGSSLKTISEGAFKDLLSLTKVVLPSGLEILETEAFSGATALEMVDFTSCTKLTSIGEKAFYNTFKLSALDLSKCISLKTIKTSAFENCENITALDFTDNVIDIIETKAFANCTGLESLILGSVSSLASNVFMNCTNLTNLVIPSAVEYISLGAFNGCGGLEEVTIDYIGASATATGSEAIFGHIFGKETYIGAMPISVDGETYYIPRSLETISLNAKIIPENAFANCTNIKNVNFLDDVLTISSLAFAGCTSIEEVNISLGIEKIEAGAFSGCSAISAITIPFVGESLDTTSGENSVFGYIFGKDNYSYSTPVVQKYYDNNTYNDVIYYLPSSLTTITLIGDVINKAAFSNCTQLTDIILTGNIEEINDYAFYNCRGLSATNYLSTVKLIGEYAYANCTGISSLEFYDALETIKIGAFENVNIISSLMLPATVRFVGEGAFSGLSRLVSLELEYTGESSSDENPLGYIFGSKEYTNSIYCNGYYLPNSLTNVTLTGEVVASSAFKDCSNLTSINISNATIIKSEAFANCLGLTSYIVSDIVEVIEEGAFSGCDNLTSLTLPFVGGTLNDTNTFKYIFGGNDIEKLTNLTVTSTVIKASAFKDCSNLTSINISNATIIKSEAFANCLGLTSYIVSDIVEVIEEGAFSGCDNLTSLTLPFVGGTLNDTNTLGYIFDTGNIIQNNNSYNIPENLAEVTITNSTEVLKDYAFANCTMLRVINMPEGITTIGKHSLEGCTNITTINLPTTVEILDEYALANNSKLSAINGIDRITNLGEYSLANNTAITSISLGNNLTTIAAYALSGLKNITSLIIPDSVISIGEGILSGNSKLGSLKLGFIGSELDHETLHTIGYLFGEAEFDSTYLVEQGGLSYYMPVALRSVEFTQGTNVSAYAFANAIYLESIIIPATITTIAEYAFAGCTGLYDYELTENINRVGDYAFHNCTNLYSILLNESIEEIGAYAFAGCVKFTEINLENVLRIEEYAFAGCSSIEVMNIPSSVQYIGAAIFSQMPKLKEISLSYIGESRTNLKTIGYLFGQNSSGTSYSSVVQNQTTYAIPNTLVNVVLKDECTIPSYAFNNMTYLKNVEMSQVTVIGEYAFAGCLLLSKIELSNILTSIETYAFKDCISLSSLTTPDSLATIGEAAFSGCYNIRSVDLRFVGKSYDNLETSESGFGYLFGSDSYANATATVFGEASYYVPNNLTKVTIRDGYVSSYAFTNCRNITELEFVDVKSIASSALTNTKLNKLSIPFTGNGSTEVAFGYIFGTEEYESSYSANGYYLPNSLTTVYLNKLTEIGEGAFNNCSKLVEVVLNDSVIEINESAFSGCSGLNHIVIPSSVTTIGIEAFSDCYATIYVENAEDVISLGSNWNLNDVVYYLDNYKFADVIYTHNDEFEYGLVGNSLIILQGIKNASTISIPNFLTIDSVSYEVTTIGESAFEMCSFDTLNIASSVKTILAKALYNITGNVLIDNSESEFGDETAINVWIEYSINKPTFNINAGNIFEDSTYGLKYTKNETSITIVGYTDSIAAELVIPATIESLPVVAISDYAFKGCTTLTSINIPNSVTSIGFGSFMGCYQISKVTIPFVGLSESDSAKNKLFGAIFGTASYDGGNATIQYYSNDDTITYYVPALLTEVVITGSEALELSFGALSGLKNITKISINNALSIGEAAFSGCEKLSTLVIPVVGNSKEQSEADADTLFGYMFGSIVYQNSLYYSATSYYNSLEAYTSYIPTKLIDVTLTGGKIMYGSFMSCKEIMKLDLQNDITTIDAYAFSGCTKLGTATNNTLDLPSNVTTIGEGAFNSCTSIYTFDLTGIINIGINAFINCTNLTSVTFDAETQDINEGAFKNCTSLNNIVIPETIIVLKSYVFAGCSSLDTLDLSSVEEIQSYALKDCIGLESLVIPQTVTTINQAAFIGLSSIEYLTLPFIGSSINNTTASAETLFGYVFGTEEFVNSERITQYYSEYVAKSYYIPKSLTTLNITGGALYYGALQNCNYIESLTIADSISIIENEALCMNVSYNEYNGVKYLGNDTKPYIWAVQAIDKSATELSLHEDTIGIYYACFKDCVNLTSFTIANNILSVGYKAFAGCSGLTQMSLKFVGNNYDNGLVPSEKTLFGYIFGSDIYDDAVQVTSFYNSTSSATYYIPRLLTKIILTDGDILDGSFSYCRNIKEVTIEAGVKSIGESVFMACTQLQKMNIAFSGYSSSTTTGTNSLFGRIFGTTEYNGSTACVQVYDNNGTAESITYYVPTTLNHLSLLAGSFYKNTFSNITTFQTIDLLNNSFIEAGAFTGCSSINTMNLSFAGASRTEEVNTSLAYIFGSDSYTNSYEVNSYYVPNTLENVNLIAGEYKSNAFSDLTSIKNVVIEANVTLVLGMFAGCNNLITLRTAQTATSTMGIIFGSAEYSGAYAANQNGNTYYLPSSLINIIYDGEIVSANAFEGFTNVENVTFIDGVTTIEESAFAGVTNLIEIDFISSINSVGDYAFANCTTLTALSIPATLTTIGKEVFSGCTNIRSIDLGITTAVLGSLFNSEEQNEFTAATQYIADDSSATYYLPDALTTVNISAENVRYGALSGITTLAEINIMNSVRTIGDYAFAGCSGVESVILPNTVTTYGRGVFGDMTTLQTVTLDYVGASNEVSDWTSTFGYVFDSRSNISNTNTYEYQVSSSIAKVIYTGSSMHNYAFIDCLDIIEFELPNLLVIPEYAFAGCSSLAVIDLPGVLTEIKDYAFYDCIGLSYIEFSEKLTTIGAHAFENAGLIEVDFTSNITTIGAYSFANCGNAVELELPQTLTTIGEGAFSNWSAVETVSLYHIGETGSGDNTMFGYIFGTTTNTTDNVAVTQFNGTSNVTYYLPKKLYKVTYYGNTVPVYAFSGCSTITEVDLENVVEVSEYSFMGCTGLSAFDFSNIRIIGNNAFSDCTGFTAITFGVQLDSIGNNAFAGCTNLVEINFNEDISAIGDYSFSGVGITSLELPKSLKTIGLGAFMDCNDLTSISLYHIGQSLTANQVFAYIFGNSSNIENNTSANTGYSLPNSLTDVIYLGDNLPIEAFANCISIENVDLSNSKMTEISAYAFYNCTGLKTISLPNITSINNYAFAKSGLESIYLGDNLTTIGEAAFKESSLTSINILDNITSINSYAFMDSVNLQTITFEEGVQSIGEAAFSGCTSVETLVMPQSVNYIGAKAFERMTSLAELTIYFTGDSEGSTNKYFGYIFGHEATDGVTAISQRDKSTSKTYYVPTSLTKVNFLGNVLVSGAFSGAINLTELTFSSNLTSVETLSLSYLSLTRLEIPQSVEEIASSALQGSASLEFLQIPFVGNVKVSDDSEASSKTVFGYIFGSTAFTGGDAIVSNYKEDESVTYYVPSSLKEVYVLDGNFLYGAFSNTKIQTVYITSNIKYIASHSLDNMVMSYPDASVSNYVRYLIDYKTNEQLWVITRSADRSSYSLSDTTIGIYDEAFKDNTSVETININSSLIYIGSKAFSGCSKLKNINIPVGVTRFYDETFLGCGLVSIGVENTGMTIAGSISHIGANAFMNNKSLTSVEFPVGLLEIASGVFAGCTAISTLALPESLEYIGEAILSNALSLSDLTIPFVGQSREATGKEAVLGYIFGSTTFTNYSQDVEQIIGENETYQYSFTQLLSKVTILDGNLSYGALSNLSMITTVVLPDSITSIGDYALSGMTSLESVTFPESLQTVGEYALSGSTKLKTISIGTNVESIGYAALSGLNNLTSVTLPFVGKSLEASDAEAVFGYIFGNESGTAITQKINANEVVEYKLPSKLIDVVILSGELKYGAFSGCSQLTSIAINQVTSIASYAFSGCTGITEFEITKTVTNINANAFSQTTSLDTLHLWFTGQNASVGANTLFGYIFDNSSYEGSTMIEQSYGNEKYEFYVPTSLENIIYKGTTVGDYAFNNVISIYTIQFVNDLVSIGEAAFMFEEAGNITSITLPESLVSIADNALVNAYAAVYNYSGLELSTEILETNAVYTDVSIYSYNDQIEYYIADNEIIVTAINGSYQEIDVPDSIDGINVTTIADYAFYNLQITKSVKLGENITTIAEGSFEKTMLDSLYVRSTAILTVDPANVTIDSFGGVFYSVKNLKLALKTGITHSTFFTNSDSEYFTANGSEIKDLVNYNVYIVTISTTEEE